MIDDDVAAILTKTRDYFNFIKGRLDQESIAIKTEDKDMLKTIDSYLIIVSEEMGKEGTVKSEIRNNVLGTCIMYLQRLDYLAKDYQLFPNKGTGSN